MPPKKPEAPESLQAVLSSLRTKDKLAIGPLSTFERQVQPLSTGNIALDAITGVGGIPRGRVTELFGLPSSGKTTTALQTAAQCQANGGSIVFLDFEEALDEAYSTALGLDVKDETFLYMQPRSFEEGANAFRRLLATGGVDLLIIDSVARMVTESELAADTGKATMADRAKAMHQFLRQITGELRRTNCGAIFLNHLLEVVDISPMGQRMKSQGITRKTTPGGMALKYYSSLRVEFKAIGNIRSTRFNPLTNEDEDVVSQTKVQATAVKNKVGDPFRTTELRVRFGRGFSQAHSVLDILVAHAAVKRVSNGTFIFPEALAPKSASEEHRDRGEDNVVHAIETDPEWLDRLVLAAQGLLDEHGTKTVDEAYVAEIESGEE